jgi:hypothetical protein
MRIRFLRDFRSQHTGEIFYEAGQVIDLESEHATPLIEEGAAEAVPLKAREGQAEPKPPEARPIQPRKRER